MRLIHSHVPFALLLLLQAHALGMPDPVLRAASILDPDIGALGIGDPGIQDAGTTQPQEKPTSKKQKAKKQKVKKPAWPKLKFSKKSTAKDKINQLVAKKPEVREKAQAKILSYGAGVVPVLLAAYHDRQKQLLRDRIRPLLDELITKEYGPVLEVSTSDKNEVLMQFALEKLDSFQDPRYAAWFRHATRHKNPAISDGAWYALARIGEQDSLQFLIEKARKSWSKEKAQILPVLGGLKGEKATDRMLALLGQKKLEDKLAALRLLHGVGTKRSANKVAAYLNSKHQVLKVEAVNALLGIMDGKKPHDHLSVFQSIDVVKKWKRRMGV